MNSVRQKCIYFPRGLLLLPPPPPPPRPDVAPRPLEAPKEPDGEDKNNLILHHSFKSKSKKTFKSKSNKILNFKLNQLQQFRILLRMKKLWVLNTK